jgi:hypothetical protein
VDSGVITDDDLDDDRRKFLTMATAASGAVGGQMNMVNLRVPPYTFADTHRLLIGADNDKGAA